MTENSLQSCKSFSPTVWPHLKLHCKKKWSKPTVPLIFTSFCKKVANFYTTLRHRHDLHMYIFFKKKRYKKYKKKVRQIENIEAISYQTRLMHVFTFCSNSWWKSIINNQEAWTHQNRSQLQKLRVPFGTYF